MAEIGLQNTNLRSLRTVYYGEKYACYGGLFVIFIIIITIPIKT